MSGFDISSLNLTPDDLAQLSQYGFQPSDPAANRSQRINSDLITMGGLLMQAKKGHVGEAIGQGLLGANANDQRMMQEQRLNELGNLQNAKMGMDLKSQAQAIRDQLAERSVLQQVYGSNGLPGSPQQPQSLAPPPDAGLGYQGGQQPQGPMPPQPQSTLSPKELAWAQSQLQPGQQAQMSAVMPGGGTGTMPMPAAGASPGAPSTPAPSAPAPSGPTVVADGGYQQKMQRAMALRDIGDKMAGQGLGLQANKYYDMADKLIPQFKEDKVYTQNGQRVVVRTYNDGSYQVLQGVQPDLEKAHMADTGNAIVPLNAFTGAPQGPAIVKSQDPNSVASNALGYAHLAETQRHNQVIEGDPATIEANAQAIAAGKQAPMTGAAARNPIAMQIMARVEQINPDFNAQDFGTAQKAMKDFSSGKLGQQTRSFSVALTHLDTLGQLADALQNKDTQVINRVGNFFSTQTGQPAPTNFNAAKQIVGDEIVKAIVGSGGGVGDREKAQQAISAASSPAQLKGVIDTYKTLMAGQLHGFQQQYEQSTGRKDFQRFLSPEAQAITTGNTTNAVRAKADAILSGQ